MKNIKILHVVPTLKKDGAEVQLALQMNHFKNVETELFTFDIYKKGNSVQSDLDNIKIHYSKVFKIYYLYKLIKKNNYKIIHSHLPMSDIVVGFLIYFDKSINMLFPFMLSMEQGKGRIGISTNFLIFSGCVFSRDQME